MFQLSGAKASHVPCDQGSSLAHSFDFLLITMLKFKTSYLAIMLIIGGNIVDA